MSWRVLNEIYNAKGIKRRLVALTGVEPANRQFSPVGSKWLWFQYSWYSRMLRNTATDRRRHSAVTAQTRAEGRRRGRRASEFAHRTSGYPARPEHSIACQKRRSLGTAASNAGTSRQGRFSGVT